MINFERSKMYYAVYKITNKINGKFYIGTHKTLNLNDSYMGSGKYLKAAQEKHGLENFTKEILFVYDNPEEMYAKEAEIVNEDFLTEENTYNLKVGGLGGWDYINYLSKNHSSRCDRTREKISLTLKNTYKNNDELIECRRQTFNACREKAIEARKKVELKPFLNKKHTDETKKRISEANSKSQSGERNSQYGTRWIHNIELKKSKRIREDELLPEGWTEGRKMKF